jgi:hypothetical protein
MKRNYYGKRLNTAITIQEVRGPTNQEASNRYSFGKQSIGCAVNGTPAVNQRRQHAGRSFTDAFDSNPVVIEPQRRTVTLIITVPVDCP